MLPGKVYRPEDILRILRKRAWLVMVPWAIVAAATAVVARKLPDTYRSYATIQVIPQRIPESIVQVSSSARLQDRLQAMQNTVLTRTRLEQLIVDQGLYASELASGMIMHDVVERFRSDLVVGSVKGDTFTVSYQGRDRRQVQKVAESLATAFLNETQKDGTTRAGATSTFVQADVNDALTKLKAVEEQVKKYKSLYASELPEQAASNQNAANSMQQQMGIVATAIQADINNRLTIERQIAELDAGGDPGPVTASASAPGMEASAAQRLDSLQRELASKKARGYSDTHPDMKLLMSAISVAKKEADAEALKTPVAAGGGLSPAEQMRRRRLAALQSDLEDVKKRIAANQQEEKRLRDAAAMYQARVDRSPARFAEMLELTREYDVLTNNYKNMLASRELAERAVRLEESQNAETFQMLEQARLPERPFSPNRPLINVFGIIGGLAVGLALVALLEYRDHSFKTDTELGKYLSLPVLAVVPLMMTGKEAKKAFRQRVLLNAACGSTVLVCVALLTYTFVR